MPFSLGFWANNLFAGWRLLDAPDTTKINWNAAAYLPLTNASWFLKSADSATATYSYSTDGSSWTSGTLPASSTTWRFIAGSDKLLAVSQNTAAYSTNGTTWTATNTLPSTGLTLTGGLWDGTRFLVTTTNTTSNGLWFWTGSGEWDNIDVGNGGYDIAYDGTSRYVVVSATSTATHRTCTSNPTSSGNWSDITFPSSASWPSVTYGNGIWVAIRSGSSSYATSTNGTTWTARTFAATPTGTSQKIVFATGKFYYINGSGDNLYESEDGINWTGGMVNGLDFIKAAAISPNKIILVGDTTFAAPVGKIMVGENV